jgi:hypothetical protein
VHALRYFIYFVTQLKNLWIKTPRVVRSARRRRATLTWASWTFQLKICCSTIVSRGKKERGHLLYYLAALLCAACIQHMIHWAFLMRRAPRGHLMMSFERRIKNQRRYNSSRALVSLFAGEMLSARHLDCLSAGVTFACWQREENAHDKVRWLLLLLTLWHTATGAHSSCCMAKFILNTRPSAKSYWGFA